MKKREQGVVKSKKMDKTICVTVERMIRHPRYSKHIRQRSVLKAHDPRNECHAGDIVEIEETRALSKTKNWRLVRIVRRAFQGEPILPQDVGAINTTDTQPQTQA